MKIRLLMIVLVLALAGGATLGHGNKVHIKGKVEKISADSLQVKTPEGKTVEVKLAASTVYLLHVALKSAHPSDANSDRPANLADLAVGDPVVIHATPKGGQLEAEQVKFSSHDPDKEAPAAKPKS